MIEAADNNKSKAALSLRCDGDDSPKLISGQLILSLSSVKLSHNVLLVYLVHPLAIYFKLFFCSEEDSKSFRFDVRASK